MSVYAYHKWLKEFSGGHQQRNLNVGIYKLNVATQTAIRFSIGMQQLCRHASSQQAYCNGTALNSGWCKSPRINNGIVTVLRTSIATHVNVKLHSAWSLFSQE